MSEPALHKVNDAVDAPFVPGRPPIPYYYKSGDRPLAGYTIRRGLGKGGFGEVYYAVSDGGKDVALKLLLHHYDIELRGVAQCLNLKNTHLVTIFDIKRNDRGEYWIVMEYIPGQTLLERLEQLGGRMETGEVLDWLQGVARAVDYLHSQGIVHRDLKPGNVFRDGSVIKVGDYSLTKFISSSQRGRQTQSVGTVYYMAPEISSGNYGRSVDVYAVATMAYEMFAGRLPFDGKELAEVLMKHLTAEPDMSCLELRLRPVFTRALAKDPRQRYQSVGELCEALREATGSHFAVVTEPARPDVAPQCAATPEASPRPRQEPGNRDENKHAAPTPRHDQRYAETAPFLRSMAPIPGTGKAKRRALGDFFWSVFLAGILSLMTPILTLAALNLFETRIVVDPTIYISLAISIGLSCCILLAVTQFAEAHRVEPGTVRLNLLFFGLLAGVLIMTVNIWLGRHIDQGLIWTSQTFLDDESVTRVLPNMILSYATLFGVLFLVPDWYGYLKRQRADRFTMGRVIWPILVALFLSSVFEDSRRELRPHFAAWFVGVIATTAIVSQWISPFEPPPKRERVVRRYRLEHA